MQDMVTLLSQHVGSSMSELTIKVRLVKDSIMNVSKSVNLGVKAHQRVQDVKVTQDDLGRDINTLLDTQVQDTMSLGQDIDETNTKFETICDDLRADIRLLRQNASAQSGLTNTGMPIVVSLSSPMDLRNQSATPHLGVTHAGHSSHTQCLTQSGHMYLLTRKPLTSNTQTSML